jgi:hypothetical protein
MFKSESKSVPFEALSGFEKPKNCDFCLTRKGTSTQGRITLGYRKNDPNIYFSVGVIASHYLLPQPLEKMDISEFDNTFPASESYIANRMAFLKLWKLANGMIPLSKNNLRHT